MTANEGSVYRSSFARWDEQAWVRSKPHRMEPFSEGLHYFAPRLCWLLNHPEVRAAPTAVRESILVHSLYIHLEFTVRLETGPVNEVCVLLRSPEFLPWLPARMKSDALRIYTDEAGHAEMTHELMSAVRRSTGVEPLPHQPRFLQELSRLYAAEPPALLPFIKVFFVIVSETLITGTLTELPKDESVQRAVREVAQDHAADEARHHAFFRQLFGFLWPRLPIPLRRGIGALLPEIVLAFLAPDGPALTGVLAGFPDVFRHPERIVAEILADQNTRQQIAHGARATMQMLRRGGVLDDPMIAAAFHRHHLVDYASVPNGATGPS